MLNNKSIFFPAGTVAFMFKQFIEDNEYKFWLKEYAEPNYYYPTILMSAAHLLKHSDLREKMNFPKNSEDHIMLGDSGGFQIATGQIKNTTENKIKLFNWLENNTNYAMNLDVPPHVSTLNDDGAQDKFFNECLAETLENFKYFEEHQSGKTKFLKVLQGRDVEHISKWYESVKDFNFDGGWGIGSASFRLYNVLLSLFFLYEKGEMNKYSGQKALFHVLGFTKTKEIVALLYFQHCLNKLDIDTKISFDSSSFAQSTGFGNYFYDISYDRQIVISPHGKEKFTKIFGEDKIANLPCSCKHCKNLKFSKTNTELYSKIMYHNMFKFIEYKNKMEDVIKCDSFAVYEDIFDSKMIFILKVIHNIFFNNLNPVKTIMKYKSKIVKIDDTDKNEKLFS